jgi:putative phosphoribosyl transferase
VADEVICPVVPARFVAVGLAYADFHQLTDQEVDALLDQGSA